MQGVFTMMQGFLTEKMRKRNQVHQKVKELIQNQMETVKFIILLNLREIMRSSMRILAKMSFQKNMGDQMDQL